MISFGVLTGILAVALSPGFAARAVSFRVGWGVGYAIVLALLIAWWVRTLRRPARLEITGEAVRFLRGNGRQKAVLSREQGDELRIVEQRASQGGRRLWLAQLNSIMDRRIPVNTFPVEEVRQACLARSWRSDATRLDRDAVSRYLSRDDAP